MPDAPREIKANVPFKDLNADDTRNALHNLLDKIESGGTFAASGVYGEAPLPGLSLTGYGEIPLPLTERDACAITKKQAEIIDKENSSSSAETPHHQWEIGADQIEPGNVAWRKFVIKIVDRAAGELGMKKEHGGLSCVLRGMHLYGKDASVDPRIFVPTDKKIVGRLSICLPSKHLGGDLHARYSGKTKKVTTGPFSAFSYSYAAWYTDVTYEVKAVHSGYRLTLEYDLFQNSTENAGSVKNLYSQKSKLRDLVMAWDENVKKDKATGKSDYPTLLAYMCDSKPANEALSIGVFKGKARQRADCLEDICSEIGMGFYLANLERTHSGFCDYYPSHFGDEDDDHHEIETEDEDSIMLTDLVHLDGRQVASGISISEYENFVENSPFDNGPDEEDFDSHHGLVTHIYRMTVLVMIPEICKSEWLPEQTKIGGQKRKREIEVIDLE